jgi:hypothetical protein
MSYFHIGAQEKKRNIYENFEMRPDFCPLLCSYRDGDDNDDDGDKSRYVRRTYSFEQNMNN